MRKNKVNWRIGFMVMILLTMVMIIGLMLPQDSGLANHGKADLSAIDFRHNELISLNGRWEFYWNRLLVPENFASGKQPAMDSLIKVPGIWDEKEPGRNAYPQSGVGTYRLKLIYPATLKDPALRIRHVANAYKIFANGRLIAEVGKVSDKPAAFQENEEALIVDLPKDKPEIELIFQVANLNYARGGIREAPLFGSKQVLEENKMILLALQLFFMGSVFIFGIYYFLLFLLQRKNKTAILFSLLCLITALRSAIWGEAPLMIFFPEMPFVNTMYINYLTGYNFLPAMILFVLSIYPGDYNKGITMLVLLPTVFYDALLLTTPGFMSLFTDYLYLVILLQMIYILSVLSIVVLRKRDNAIVMFIAVCIFILAVVEDILHYKGMGGINVSYMFLYGNFAVLMAMSFVQARQQADTQKTLIRYNENLREADRLKDEIMASEMSFLQAQIKPHFLYNALNAIANVCEKDGQKASGLILDLAVYLRGSLVFNNLDKMVTIEKELEFVNTYFHIEQARFGEKIQLHQEITIPLSFQIPVLILQPLVENAVRHGISKKPGGGTVQVRMEQTNEGILLEIKDDGVGIPQKKLMQLLDQKKTEPGIGILNIHHRLLRLYGRGLEITSEVGQGTYVKIVIPERRKQG